ncbi:MAG TPA: hypothetical protein VMT50_02480, partial [Steroidobacteraceae bacterium]|nr:hypothetical protein [Steroidobacteraceae bacterium]
PLAPFTEKNVVPPRALRRSKLLQRLIADGDGRLVERDVNGRVHFQGAISNARDVSRVLHELQSGAYAALARRETALVLEIFEKVFDHESFTGRSGTFYGYEGLGCIYWHMVSKLLLATQESCRRAVDAGAPAGVVRGLVDCYYDVRAGLGDAKAPEHYGAFPMEPYSHTPGDGGARQPGLTGQVKEDILSRFGELGVRIRDGRLEFQMGLLRNEEFLGKSARFRYFDVDGRERTVALRSGELAFTLCQVLVVLRRAMRERLVVHRADGSRREQRELSLDTATSRSVFERAGEVVRIEVSCPR